MMAFSAQKQCLMYNVIYSVLIFLQEGLVEFHENGAEKNHESPWPSLGKICIGAVGVLALGAILTQKS